MHRLGIVVNPMSGRDVRRVAARASTTSHHDKQQQVTRLVLAALEHGVEEIYLMQEPFRINQRATENLAERNRITLLELPLTHSGEDTVAMTDAMWARGCRTFIVLGGDGTCRIVAGRHPDANILPLSTGTNNVFPLMIEASVAGAAAGLVATGKVDAGASCRRCKRVHVRTQDSAHFALVDAVLLRNDLLGSFLPFDPANIARVALAIAKPDAIGMSPIGGYLMPCGPDDDFGVDVTLGREGNHIRVPISAGLYGDLDVAAVEQVALGTTVEWKGPGILAFDGDRTVRIADEEVVSITIRRDGPRVIEPATVMQAAVAQGKLSRPSGGPANG